MVDNSGVRITFVDSGDPTTSSSDSIDFQSAGYLYMGSALPSLFVPGNQRHHHVQTPDCTFRQLPSSGVTAYAFILHAHGLGRQLWTEVSRDGEYLRDAGCDTQFDFDLQQTIGFADTFQIYDTDTFTAHCIYDSSERDYTTPGGDETEVREAGWRSLSYGSPLTPSSRPPPARRTKCASTS